MWNYVHLQGRMYVLQYNKQIYKNKEQLKAFLPSRQQNINLTYE
jgi:hypothetical protein